MATISQCYIELTCGWGGNTEELVVNDEGVTLAALGKKCSGFAELATELDMDGHGGAFDPRMRE